MAQRYHNKPLVLSDEQEELLPAGSLGVATHDQGLCAVRAHAGTGADNPHYSTLVATILHRCLYYTGMIIIEHFRARRELPAGIWHELHGYYETAEQWGVSCTPVNDSLENDLQATHCAAAYVTLLLIEIANPYGKSVRDLSLVRRWASMWAPLVSLHPVDDEYEVPPYLVEFTKDQPLHPTGSADSIGSDARRLDTARLGLQISHMLSQLQQRLTPVAARPRRGNIRAHVRRLLEASLAAVDPDGIATQLPPLRFRWHGEGRRRFRSHAFLRGRQGIHPAGFGQHLFTRSIRRGFHFP